MHQLLGSYASRLQPQKRPRPAFAVHISRPHSDGTMCPKPSGEAPSAQQLQTSLFPSMEKLQHLRRFLGFGAERQGIYAYLRFCIVKLENFSRLRLTVQHVWPAKTVRPTSLLGFLVRRPMILRNADWEVKSSVYKNLKMRRSSINSSLFSTACFLLKMVSLRRSCLAFLVLCSSVTGLGIGGQKISITHPGKRDALQDLVQKSKLPGAS